MQYIALDAHKHYSLGTIEKPEGGLIREQRIEHEKGRIRAFLRQYGEPGSPVAVETVGNWYWIVDEIEAAGFVPRLVNARKAKLMMGNVNKTDNLDNGGMNQLQRTKTLPTVWIPPSEIRDLRDLPRTRMVLVGMRTRLKNRLHSALDKYALTIRDVSDIFKGKGRVLLEQQLEALPPETKYTSKQLLKQLDELTEKITTIEVRIREVIQETPEIRLIDSLPGVGPILSTLIALEIGSVGRFPTAPNLASYAGTAPRVFSSGGKTRYLSPSSQVNHYLRWAYIEAANVIAMHHEKWPGRHVSRLYRRIRDRKGHGKAAGAVARHLAEATYWILTKKEPYREPKATTPIASKAG